MSIRDEIDQARQRSRVEIPPSMKAELAAWDNGQGIDLESWTGREGNFGLAVGYATIFWPRFVEYEGYILRAGFLESGLRGFEAHFHGDRRSVEAMMNHFHIADIQYEGCPDVTKDKLLCLGTTFKEIHEAKLSWQFPGRPCRVSFHIPEDESDLHAYEITFWQLAHESSPA